MGVSRTAQAVYNVMPNTECIAWGTKMGSTDGPNFPG